MGIWSTGGDGVGLIQSTKAPKRRARLDSALEYPDFREFSAQ